MGNPLKRLICRRSEEGGAWQAIDMHCHVLPGLDDGARDLSEAVSMLQRAAEEGISDVIATPHFHAGRFAASPEVILQKLRQLQGVADAERIPIRLYPGSEIYYSDEVLPWLRQRCLCTMNGSGHVLIEFSPLSLFRTMQNALGELLDGGYRPILAHVERYACLLNCPDDAFFLREMGVQLQINAATFIGKAEPDERRFVLRLLKERAVDYIATDAHDRTRRAPEIAYCRKIVTAKCNADYAYRVMRGNAEEMLRS